MSSRVDRRAATVAALGSWELPQTNKALLVLVVLALAAPIGEIARGMGGRCEFWLPNKRRFCANPPLPNSKFCGNHNPTAEAQRAPCPIDPSHSVLVQNLESHLQKCPMRKRVMQLESQPFYQNGVNAGGDDGSVMVPFVSSEEKRNAIYGMDVVGFLGLVRRIRSVHSAVCGRILRESYVVPEVCAVWLNQQQERKLPFQEKHALQQASILGNMEAFGILKKLKGSQFSVPIERMGDDRLSGDEVDNPAVIEFGAGRGYLTQMLADCYGINRVFLVERRSYKLKADRSLRQNKSMILERLRIDIEDLNLNAVESLRGLPYLAVGKHICGPATDLTMRCCLHDQNKNTPSLGNCYLEGLALATCCHHLCQWQHYINKKFLTAMGITEDDFHAITWFSSWAVDADHSSSLLEILNQDEQSCTVEERESEMEGKGVEATIRNMKAGERAALGFICKDVIDIGRLLWLEDHGLDANLLKYVASNISPENHLIVAKLVSHG